jgi:fructokinase
LVEAIIKSGLDSLTEEVLKAMLNRATKAAAITVSRTGANPPSKEEID